MTRVHAIQNELKSSANLRAFWKNLNHLLHRQKQDNFTNEDSTAIAQSFNTYFVDKIKHIHLKIESFNNSQQFIFLHRSNLGPTISSFNEVTSSDISSIIKQSCKKTSPIDPFPQKIFINCIEPLSITITNLINLSLKERYFPSLYKTAQITPLLKKPNLDQFFLTNYRPISNSTTISKIIEKAILKQFLSHIINNPNYSKYQSAYRSHHSTETALTHVFDEVFSACNDKMITVCTGLDLFAAFDTINHQILIDRLSEEFGVKDSALKWISS